MLLYILCASSEANAAAVNTASVSSTLVAENETITFSIGGVPLTLSKEAIKKYSDSNFNKLLDQAKNGGIIDSDENGNIIIPVKGVLSRDADRQKFIDDLEKIVSYVKELETGELKDFSNLHDLVQRRFKDPGAIKKVNLSQIVAYIKEFMETGTLKELENPTEKIMYNYADLCELAEQLSLKSLCEILERFLYSRSVSVSCNVSRFDSIINKLESKKDNTLSVLIEWDDFDLKREKKITLFQKLAQMPYLVLLSLRRLGVAVGNNTPSYGDVKSEGAKILADLFRNSPALTDLEIIDGAIGDEGAIALASMLETNKHLKVLNLRRNNITDLGVVALLDALKTNTSLKEINLQDNNFSKVGIEKLVEVLRTNKSIQKVTLYPSTEYELQQAVKAEFQQRVDFNF